LLWLPFWFKPRRSHVGFLICSPAIRRRLQHVCHNFCPLGSIEKMLLLRSDR
jgi:hypothetical protein